MMTDYKRFGYSDNWINQRLKSIEIRKDLTYQWKLHNVEEGIQYATLIDIIAMGCTVTTVQPICYINIKLLYHHFLAIDNVQTFLSGC